MVGSPEHYETGPESAEEREMSRRQDDSLMWRRRMAFAACPVCFHCGYLIATLADCRMVLNHAGKSREPKLFHADPCYASALELMKIRATTPLAHLLASVPDTSNLLTRDR